MKKWALALALVFLTSFAHAAVPFTPTVNPLVPVQNSPLASMPVRANAQATYNDEVTLASLIPAPGADDGTVTNVTCSATLPATCSVATSSTTPAITLTLPQQGNGSLFQMSLGSTTSGDIVIFDPNGNAIDSGTACCGSTITWPTTHDVVVSNSTNTPVGLGGTSGQILQFNGVSADPTAVSTLSATVQGNITTLGTIGTGTWQGSVIAPTYLAVSTSTTEGIVQVDNSTITISGGVISAVTGGGGNVSGPASSTTSAIATYADTTGKLLVNNTGVTIVSNAVLDTQSIAASSTDGLALQDTTSATVGAQKWSPRLRWTGDGWKTTSTAAGQLVDAIAELQPVQGTTNPTFNWVLSGQINGAGYNPLLTVPSGGGLNLASGTYQIGGTQIACTNLSNGATGCSTATGTSGATIPLLNGANTWSGVQTFSANDLSASNVIVTGSGAPTNGIYLPAASTPAVSANSIEVEQWNTLGSGVDFLSITPGKSGTAVSIKVGGTTANQNLAITATGSGTVSIDGLTATTSGSVGAVTNGYYDTAASGNTFKINGTAISAVTGTGAVALAGSPTFTGTVGAAAITATGVVTGGALVAPPDTLTISTSTFTPVSVGSNTFRVVLVHASCPCTIAAPSGGAVDGAKFILELWQSATGSDTVSFTTGSSGSYDFGTAGAPTLSTGANKGDFLGFSYSAQNSRYNYIGIQQGM